MKKKGKLNRTRRFIASFIDSYIIFYICGALLLIIEPVFKTSNWAILLYIAISLVVTTILSRKKDTYFPNQCRSLWKIIMGLYIVDSEGRIIKDKKLIEEKNEITWTISNIPFYIYRVLFFNESEAEDKLKIYVVNKVDVKDDNKVPSE